MLRSAQPAPSLDVGSAITHVDDPYTYTFLLVILTVTVLTHDYRYRHLFPLGRIMPCLIAPTPLVPQP
jgi:hypothetical protein